MIQFGLFPEFRGGLKLKNINIISYIKRSKDKNLVSSVAFTRK